MMNSDDSRLILLLRDTPSRECCIDRVEKHLADICDARRRKVTWNIIADSLCMNRGTLINAVKALTEKKSVERQSNVKLSLPDSTYPISIPVQLNPAIVAQVQVVQSDAQTPAQNVGLIALGRTRIESFNLNK